MLERRSGARSCAAAGALAWVPGNSKAGATVALRAELPTLVVLSNTPHPLDPRKTYAPKPLLVAVEEGPAPGPHDECREKRPENGRGFELTEEYFR